MIFTLRCYKLNDMLVLGNILALLGQISFAASGLIKDRLKTLTAQIIALALLAAANAVLGGIVGCLVNLVNVARNVIWYKKKGNLAVKVVLSAAVVVLSVIGRDHGFLWLLPMASALVFLWGIDLCDWKFKLMVAITTLLWLPYDLFLGNYIGVGFDVAGTAFNLFTAYCIRSSAHAEEERMKDNYVGYANLESDKEGEEDTPSNSFD